MFNPPKLIGHRGVKDLSPENTIESISRAKKLGLKCIEVDVKISKDLVPILLHDDTLERTTNGKGFPIDLLYKDLKKLDAGIFFYNRPTKIYIPKLDETIDFCLKNNIGINIELKPNLGFETQNVNAVYKVLKNFKFIHQIYFSSFDWKSIILMKQIMPDVHCGLLIDDFDEKITLIKILDTCKKYDFSSCGFNNKIVNNSLINEMKNNNLITTAYSEKKLKCVEVNDLLLKGVDSVFIDDPSNFEFF